MRKANFWCLQSLYFADSGQNIAVKQSQLNHIGKTNLKPALCLSKIQVNLKPTLNGTVSF